MTPRYWHRLRKQMPVKCLDRDFFEMGRKIEQRLDSTDASNNPAKTMKKLLNYNQKINSFVEHFKRELNKVYAESAEYRTAAKTIYKLVDINLRFYRYDQIQRKFEDIQGRGNRNNNFGIMELIPIKNSMQQLVKIIKNAVHEANTELSGEQDLEVEEHVAYLTEVAINTEIAIRHYAKHSSSDENDKLINYYDMIEQGERKELLEDMNQQGQENELVQQGMSDLEAAEKELEA